VRCVYGRQASVEIGDTDLALPPKTLTDDQVIGVMNACATGDVHELEK